MTKDEALKLALEALKNGKKVRAGGGGTTAQPVLEDAAINAIKEALAQPEWVGLTDEQIRLDAHNADSGDWNDDRYQKFWHEGFKEGARGAESMLKESNT
jgi:hypothetical protein